MATKPNPTKKKRKRPPKHLRKAHPENQPTKPIPPPTVTPEDPPTPPTASAPPAAPTEQQGISNPNKAQDNIIESVCQFFAHPYFRENEDYYEVVAMEEGYTDYSYTHVVLPPMSHPPIYELFPETHPTSLGDLGLRAYQLNAEQLAAARKMCKAADVVPVKLKPRQWLFVLHWDHCKGDFPKYCNVVPAGIRLK
eukprot:TRINITY_DN67944_c1_g1_i10.p1 TRINITY_DN67944_c1_g1~~TRINITY_DN67944_c1_g1_i10.p1  ORF type:complete len:195 (+),score=21.18 TRINITY_DN67944_c1_g1_i10:556-1140(+)